MEDARYVRFLGQWCYDLTETRGDGALNDVLESVIEPVVHPDAAKEVTERLFGVTRQLYHLKEVTHNVFVHIEAMQHCSVFIPMATDLAKLHNEVGHLNSVRVWIENEIRKAQMILDGEEPDGEPEEV